MHAAIFLWQPAGAVVRALPAFDLVVAADSGLEAAEHWGVRCDLAVGDFDSASPEAIVRAEQTGVALERVPAAKDETDRDLAVAAALNRGATSMTFIGSTRGRADHALVAMQGLGHHTMANVTVDAWIDDTYVQVVRDGSVSITAENGKRVSLIPALAVAAGVTTSGLAWPLDNAVLQAGSGFSVSNEMTGEMATVSVAEGPLLVMQSEL